MSVTVYIDWNVFNKLEKTDVLNLKEYEIYLRMKDMIDKKMIIVPYSNAHMSDLARGYLKNSAFIEKHIETITAITNNLCIVQYWGQPRAKWHYRDPQEFLNSTIQESHATANSFSELLYMDGEPFLNSMWSIQKTLLQLQRLDENFKDIYKADPIFNSIFPRTKVEMNKLALCEDLYQFSSRIKTDYALYRNFQKFLTQTRLKFPQYQKLLVTSQQKIIGNPKYLTWESLVDNSHEQVMTKSPNVDYDRIMSLFTKTDLKGYRSDERFANMIDDGLHCFYAAHCDYFVTIDKRCSDKSKRVYTTLKIATEIMNPDEFINHITKTTVLANSQNSAS